MADDLDATLDDLPEVRAYGVPGLLVGSEDALREMQREKAEYDFYLDAAYDYELEVIDKGIREQAEKRARTYLSENGDAVWARVARSVDGADRLLDVHPGASLALCMTAAELSVRFLMLRPMLAGFIFDDALAERLSIEAATGPAGRDRDTLPHACRAWGIDLAGYKVDTDELWPTYGRLWNVRHGFVHRGEEVSKDAASLAMASMRALIEGPLTDLVIRLDLHWPEKPWLLDRDEAKDPFERKR